MTINLYKNITNKKITLPVTFDVIEPGQTYSLSTEYPSPPLNVPGVIEITTLSVDEQKKAEKEALGSLDGSKD